MKPTESEDAEVLGLRAESDRQRAFAEIFARHRSRLRRMVRLRMSDDMQGRLDPSDVLQEAWLEASSRLDAYVEAPPMPLFLWLRFLTRQKLLALRRQHVDVQARDVRREVSPLRAAAGEASTEALAAQLLGHLTTPTHAARRAEMRTQIHQCLDALDPIDRQILVLRHFERLSNAETASEMEMSEAAASKRFIRALMKLGSLLAPMGLDLGNERP